METLDTLHTKHIDDLNKEKDKIPEKLLEIRKLKDEMIKADPYKHIEISNKITNLEEEIKNIQNRNELQDYYVQNGQVLFMYYDTIQNIDENSVKKKKRISDTHSIVSYFEKDVNESDEIEDDDEPEEDENDVAISRDFLRNRYVQSMGLPPSKKESWSKFYKQNEKLNSFCENCGAEFICVATEGILECTQCGIVKNIIIDIDKPSYREVPKDSCSYSYKRANHFNEWIAQFQAKETTQIPRTVLYQIIAEIKKERITNLSDLSSSKVRSLLKKLKLNKYYEHIPHIINQLNGKAPPCISRQTEETFRIMFQKIQGPFIEYCPKNRKNFLSYSYVLHKFVELLGMEDLKPLFPLLKSREKLHQQDQIWKKICEHVGWDFHKSM